MFNVASDLSRTFHCTRANSTSVSLSSNAADGCSDDFNSELLNRAEVVF